MLALLGSLSHTSKRDVTFDAGAPVVAAPHGSRHRSGGDPHLSPLGNRPPVSAAETALQATLSGAMRASQVPGGGVGGLVYDLDARTELFALHTQVRRPPASIEKLWTTVAVLRRLGPTTRLHTTVLGAGSLRHGVWHGNLYLRGGGDPTFGDPTFNQVWNGGNGPTAIQLADQLAARGIHRVTGHLIADESLFDIHRGGLMTGLKADVPDFGGQLSALTYDHGSTAPHYSPATFAAHEMMLTMRSMHISVRASMHTGRTPRQAHLLAIVSSPPMLTMTRLMDVPSDDLFAELFAKQLGVLFGRGGSIAAGAQVIAQTIAQTYGLHPRILDGSGLSRNDGSSPLEVVELLREVWHTAVGDELWSSLPTVGVNGTVQGVGVKTAAARHCVAKTGTLNFVTNLAGYCDGRSGHTLAFALFIDGPDNGTAILEESKMVAAIARY